MLREITFCANHARRIDAPRTMKFLPGMNTIIGPNGTGKSTVLRAIKACPDCRKITDTETSFTLFETELMNPRTGDGKSTGILEMILHSRARFSSHGEALRSALSTVGCSSGECLLIDEPESGQDLDGVERIHKVLTGFCREGCQIIVASHHPIFWDHANLIELRPGYARKVIKDYQSALEDIRRRLS